MFKFYIGTYTKKESKGIYSAYLDESKGTIHDVNLEVETNNPTYLIKNETKIYSISKKEELSGISAFNIEKDKLVFINDLLEKGTPGCYLAINKDNSNIVLANYHDDLIALYSLNSDGSIKECCDKIYYSNDKVKPHPHYINFTPNQKDVFMCDLGMDVIRVYSLENNKLKLKQTVEFAKNTGPRHAVFSPNEKFLYVLSELSNELFVLEYDDEKFSIKQKISTLPNDFKGDNGAAAIRISKDGRFVYVSNRSLNDTGVDSITTFAVKEGGLVEVIDYTDSGGKHPRDFILDPTNNYLLVANLITQNIVVYKRDQNTGKLMEKTDDIKVNEPVCFLFK